MFSTPAELGQLSGLTSQRTQISAGFAEKAAETPDFSNNQALERTAPSAGVLNVGRLAQSVERDAYTVEVVGSFPAPPTIRRRDFPSQKAYMRAYQLEWWRRRRAAFFAGKSCEKCSSSVRLQLHHCNPKDKVAHSIWSWSEARRQPELEKCVVLCADCHQSITSLDFASRRLPALKPPGASGLRNISWYPQRRTWRVEFTVMGRRVWVGGGGFHNIVTARLAAESFRAALSRYLAAQNIPAAIACRKQLRLPLGQTA